MRLLVPTAFLGLSLACCCPLWKTAEEAVVTAPVPVPAPVVPTPSRVPPKADPALTTEQRAAWSKAMDDARVLHRKKDYTKAIARFSDALALFPDDPRALNERGWAELFAGKLDAAEADTRKAIARTTDTSLVGSSYYNLGRIQEEQGKVQDAIVSYRASLRVRPNQTVQDRLATLSPDSVGPARLAAVPMTGPFTDLAAFCTRLKAERPDYDAFTCDPASTELGDYTGASTAPPVAPYTEVRVLAAMGEPADTLYNLAVRLPDGWYVAEELARAYNPGAFGIFEAIDKATLEVKDVVPGGAPEVVYQYTHHRSDEDAGIAEVETNEGRYLVVCGGSPKPSCVGPLLVGAHDERSVIGEGDGGKHETFDRAWDLSVTFTPDGSLSIVPVTGTPPADVKIGVQGLGL